MARTVSLILGLAFVGIGIAGSLIGGHNHLLFTLFGVNFFHNTVHVLSGLAAL